MSGAGGLLGGTLVPLWRRHGADVVAWTHAQLDVTSAESVVAALRTSGAEVVVHCAAWTDVDAAEADPEGAMRVNALGTRNVAEACAAAGVTLVHISTDYVFDGTATAPIPATAELKPLGAYARSKAAAELAVRAVGENWLIIRTGWMYGPGGRNFVDSMKKLAIARESARVVNDQTGAPTSAMLVAAVLWRLVEVRTRGVWHIAGAGQATWFDVARTIFEVAPADPDLVRPCTSAQLNRPAPRPAYAVLDCTATERMLGTALPGWREQVGHYVRHGSMAVAGFDSVAA